MEEKEIHLVKKVSKELGLTYKELGEKIGYTENNLKKLIYDNRTPYQLVKAIELYLQTLELEEKLNESEDMKKQFKVFLHYFTK